MFFSVQLRVIQRMVDGVSDHIEDSLSLLQRLQQPTHTLSGTVCVCVCVHTLMFGVYIFSSQLTILYTAECLAV